MSQIRLISQSNQGFRQYIVACQQGGVSNKPPGLRAAIRHGARDPLGPYTGGLARNFKKKKSRPYIIGVLLRQGEPGTSHYPSFTVMIIKHDNQHED